MSFHTNTVRLISENSEKPKGYILNLTQPHLGSLSSSSLIYVSKGRTKGVRKFQYRCM